MPTKQQLSPVYGLSLIRLAGADELMAWPGLLLHSHSLTWAFDPHSRPLSALEDIHALAVRAGLHRVEDPFAADLAAPSEPWTFRLPTPRRPAHLECPGMVVEIGRTPNVTDDWWRQAVIHGGRCRLLVAACVAFPADPAGVADVLIEAATGRRVYGAEIGVEF